jgi:hypothetical protein
MDPTPEELAKAAADKATADEAAKKAAERKDPLETFNAYLATLDPEVAKEIEGYTTNLKSALVSERGISKTGKEALAQLKVLQDAEDVRKAAALTEVERAALAKKVAEDKALELQEQLKDERLKSAILAAASKANFEDPQDAYTLIDRTALEIDANGKVTGVDDALKVLAKAKPYLLTQEGGPRYNLNSGDHGRSPQGAGLEELKKKKRGRYGSGI